MGHTFALDIRPKAGANGGANGCATWLRGAGTEAWDSPWVSWMDMGVSKDRGTPKWMVYNEKPY